MAFVVGSTALAEPYEERNPNLEWYEPCNDLSCSWTPQSISMVCFPVATSDLMITPNDA
jgi:hypothetical protein